MPATLLAVDDSRTMRKVLEMTFGGEDVRVVLAESADAAFSLMRSENPSIVVADAKLPGKSGYELCQAIKQINPSVPVLLLSSKQHPYDAAKGSAVRVDGNLEKPFDSQALIDRVKALLSGERPAIAQGAPKPPAAAPYRAPAALSASLAGPPSSQRLPPKPTLTPAPMPAMRATSAPLPAATPQTAANVRATMDFSTRTPAAGTPIVGRPIPHAPPPPARVTAAPSAAFAKASDDLAAKLSAMGLTKTQVEGVLALSREVVERVVWEVVPVLAETMIKEELQRLTSE